VGAHFSRSTFVDPGSTDNLHISIQSVQSGGVRGAALKQSLQNMAIRQTGQSLMRKLVARFLAMR
jgi:hypothetical protein